MAQRMTPSQFRSRLQQVQNRQRQAISRYNQAVRDYNRKVNTAIDNYNREARAHNARVRADRQRLLSALSNLRTRTTASVTVTRYVRLRTSVETLHRAYESLEGSAASAPTSELQDRLLDLSERENANSLDVMNALLVEGRDETPRDDDLSRLRDTRIGDDLRGLSEDLGNRWQGALFALHPANPDASRHFCTSAREIFTTVLENRTPDDDVRRGIPECPLTREGRPTRRARIQFAMKRKGIATASFEEFVHEDVENILELFTVFNDGTHGAAGRFRFDQLVAIKKRVEDGIAFLHHIFV